MGKSISLEPDVLEQGTEMARRRGFRNSFSAYVSWLIEEDKRSSEDHGPQEPPKEAHAA